MTETLQHPDDQAQRPPKVRSKAPGSKSIFDPAIVKTATVDAIKKLNPRTMMRNPVMFIVEVGSVLTTYLFIRDFSEQHCQPERFAGLVAAWLWFTVFFANFAEAMAEGRGKAQAAALRRTRADTIATIRMPDGSTTQKSSAALLVGDLCVVVAGEVIPGDGEIVEGIATVDESAITGESAPVIRESGGDRSAVTGGTRVLSDEIVVRITAKPGETFLDRMIALVEGANRQKTPNEIALSILLAGLTIIFLLAVATLQPFAIYSGAEQSIIVLVALLVCLIPTTIGGLLSAIGIAGMDRLVQRNVLAMSGRAVEAAGDCTTLLLDKTGTITYGSRQAAEFIPVTGVDRARARRGCAGLVAGRRDTGGTIHRRAGRQRLRADDHRGPGRGARAVHRPDAHVGHGPERRTPGPQGRGRFGSPFRRGRGRLVPAGGAAGRRAGVEGRRDPPRRHRLARRLSAPWRVLGVIRLKDTVKPGMRERFDQMRAMGIRTIMITGDNPLTAAAIADEAGVDGFLAEATPEDKMALIKREQAGGNLVAMTGDGTNDAPALAQADVGVAMNTGHPGGEGGRQHGRPRQQPHEADRDRRSRQAAADHSRVADDVLDRQRRRQVLRHHPGDVLRRVAGARLR